MEGTPVRKHTATRLPKHWDWSSVLNGSHVMESTAGVGEEPDIEMTLGLCGNSSKSGDVSHNVSTHTVSS